MLFNNNEFLFKIFNLNAGKIFFLYFYCLSTIVGIVTSILLYTGNVSILYAKAAVS